MRCFACAQHDMCEVSFYYQVIRRVSATPSEGDSAWVIKSSNRATLWLYIW